MTFLKIICAYILFIIFYYYFFKFMKFCWNKFTQNIKYNKLKNEYFHHKFIDILDKNNRNSNYSNLKKGGYMKRKNNSIMTSTELNFYRILREFSSQNNYTVFSQVALNSIIDVNKTGDRSIDTSLNNKIQNKIIDFVLCSSVDYTIKYCIELDDYSHNYSNRIKRDEFLNQVFEEVGIPLKHIKVKSFYSIEDLNSILRAKSQ